MVATTPLLSTPAAPWPAPEFVSHPRIFGSANRVARLRSRWTDPAWSSVVKIYKNKTDPFSTALQYLATGSATSLAAAVRTAVGIPYRVYVANKTQIFADAAAFVLDWCYPALSAGQRGDLASYLEANNANRAASLPTRFSSPHEAHFVGFHAYLIGTIAVQGEPRTSDRRAECRNAVQNYTNYVNEIWGDGIHATYSYQTSYFSIPSILYDLATGFDLSNIATFVSARPEAALRLMNTAGSQQFYNPSGDQGCNAEEVLSAEGQAPDAAFALAMTADYRRDGVAQWTARLAHAKQRTWNSDGNGTAASDTSWVALLCYDDTLTATAPSKLATCKSYPTAGAVNFRSGLNFGVPGNTDINAWFYCGPGGPHQEQAAGHLSIRRGDDILLTSGANYLGSPSNYKSRWSQYSFSRNCLVFSPAGSATPDASGSQVIVKPNGSERAYPIAAAITSNHSGPWLSGQLTSFADDGIEAHAIGDCRSAYSPLYVKSYTRGVSFVRPGTFIIRDTFSLSGVDRIRAIFFCRSKPVTTGEVVLAGNSDAGVLTCDNPISVVRGASKATIEMISSAPTVVRLVGGVGFENFIDGSNVDAASNASSTYVGALLSNNLAKITGQWRVEFESSPTTTELVFAITVTDRGIPAPSIGDLGIYG